MPLTLLKLVGNSLKTLIPLLFFISIYINQAPFNLFSSLFCLLALVVLVVRYRSTLAFMQSHSWFFILLVSYLFAYILINSYHHSSAEDFEYALRRMRWVFYALLVFPYLVLEKERIVHFLSSAKFMWFFYIMVGITCLMFADSVLRFVYGGPVIAKLIKSSNLGTYGIRASWTYNPIPYSKIVVFLGNAFLACAFFQLQKNKTRFWISLLCAAQLFMIVIWTQTRATWLALACLFPLIFFLESKHRKWIISFSVGSLVVLMLLPGSVFWERVKSFGAMKSFSNQYRVEQFKANVKLSLDHPLIGVGYANNRKKEVISPYLVKFTKDEKRLYTHPHNEYLDVLSGMGYPLFFVFLVILVLPLLRAFQLLFAGGLPQEYKYLLLSFLASLLVCYITAAFDKIMLTTWAVIVTCWSGIFILSGLKISDQSAEKNA